MSAAEIKSPGGRISQIQGEVHSYDGHNVLYGVHTFCSSSGSIPTRAQVGLLYDQKSFHIKLPLVYLLFSSRLNTECLTGEKILFSHLCNEN